MASKSAPLAGVVDASGEPPFAGSWHDFGLAPGLADAVRTHKGRGKLLERPSTIQRHLLKAPDRVSVLGVAPTGSGKALAFVVPVLDAMLKGRARAALVLAITNPLLDQHVATFSLLRTALPSRASIGPALKANPKAGAAILQAAARGPVFVFSTPHQILELSKRPEFAAFVRALDAVIVDEVDGVVADPVFGRQVARIAAAATRSRLIAVTATDTPAALAAIRKMSHRPVLHVIAGKVHAAVVEHTAVFVAPRDLMPVLAILLVREARQSQKVMVFCPTGAFAEFAFAYCVAAGLRGAMRSHTKLSASQAKRAQRDFHACKQCVVFCSDFLGRGMDFEGVTHVVQVGYVEPDRYMQRAGRSGRGLVATGRSTLVLTEPERACAEAVAKARKVKFREIRAVPEAKLPLLEVPAKTVAAAYKSWVGAYKGSLKALRWSKDALLPLIGAIVQGAGFRVPQVDDKWRRKVGL